MVIGIYIFFFEILVGLFSIVSFVFCHWHFGLHSAAFKVILKVKVRCICESLSKCQINCPLSRRARLRWVSNWVCNTFRVFFQHSCTLILSRYLISLKYWCTNYLFFYLYFCEDRLLSLSFAFQQIIVAVIETLATSIFTAKLWLECQCRYYPVVLDFL